MVKVDIISGFLGAGKTTLIKKLIAEVFQGEKLVLIENEFGEIAVDGGFLKEAGVQITEMNSGCICCSLVGDFGKALGEVITTYSPERIIIEPSGVGKLSDVIAAVQRVSKEHPMEIGGCVTVVDACKCKMYMKNFGEFFNNQIENAGTLVLSRTQKLSEEKLEECVSLLRGINEKAKVLTTPWDLLNGTAIKEAMDSKNTLLEEMLAEEICPVCGHHHHHDDNALESEHNALEDEHDEHEHEHDEHEHEHDHEHDEHEHEHDHDHHHHDNEDDEHDHHHHHHDGHHHHADEVFETWGKETPKHFTESGLKQILDKLGDDETYGVVLRAKGIVSGEGECWLEFDYVPGEYEVRSGFADYTGRFCVIGSKLNDDMLSKLFLGLD